MKNKYRLALGAVIIIIALAGFYSKSYLTDAITGGSVLTPANDGLPETLNRIITADVEAADMGGGNWGLYQRYRNGNDGICIRDCIAACTEDGLGYYRAYVQSYGNCMCKCAPAAN